MDGSTIELCSASCPAHALSSLCHQYQCFRAEEKALCDAKLTRFNEMIETHAEITFQCQNARTEIDKAHNNIEILHQSHVLTGDFVSPATIPELLEGLVDTASLLHRLHMLLGQITNAIAPAE